MYFLLLNNYLIVIYLKSNMSVIVLNGFCQTYLKVISRAFSCSQTLEGKKWRIAQGLSANRNADGILTDGPDFTYLDGRPTPLLHKQKLRMLKNRDYANTIVGFISEVDFAKQRHQDMIRASEEERQNIISNRLKPKGKALYKK